MHGSPVPALSARESVEGIPALRTRTGSYHEHDGAAAAADPSSRQSSDRDFGALDVDRTPPQPEVERSTSPEARPFARVTGRKTTVNSRGRGAPVASSANPQLDPLFH